MHDAEITDTVISTPRLELRPLTPEDAAEIFAAITPELTRFLVWAPCVAGCRGGEPVAPDIGHGGRH